MKKAFIFLLTFVTVYSAWGQSSTKEYDPEALSKAAMKGIEVKEIKQEEKRVDDNLLFFNELSFDAGIYLPFKDEGGNFDASIYSIQGAHFFSNNRQWGVRSGISFINGIDNTDYYLNVPLLFSFRTNSLPPIDFFDTECPNIGEIITNIIFSLMPRKFEFNLGPNIGYIQPDGEHVQNSYLIKRRFALSIDAGARFTYSIWRIGLVVSPTVSYLPTANFKYYSTSTSYTTSQPTLFFKGTFGLSFRF